MGTTGATVSLVAHWPTGRPINQRPTGADKTTTTATATTTTTHGK